MKKFKFDKRKVQAVCIGTFLAGIVFSESVFATDLEINVTKEFEKWNDLSTEEKQESFMPRTYSSEIPENILSEYNVPSLLSKMVGKSDSRLEDVQLSNENDSRYNLADSLNMRIEDQGSTSECWAFSMMKSMETNVAKRSGTSQIPDFSERHMDYATSRTFTDGTNPQGFKREVGTGGLPVSALAYLTNGQGAVLESDMPFKDNESKISLSEINKTVDTIVTEYEALPTIKKQYTKDAKGNTTSVKYVNANGTEYSSAEVTALRKMIKKAIVENGAVPSVTAANYAKYYNGTSIFTSSAYNCNEANIGRDHGITIVGWDDNYSKDNFAEGAKPSTNGAYIVLNSYGEDSFDKGYIYISYEDTLIESELYTIKNTSKKDYENIYQADFYGGVFSIGTSRSNTGYIANTYTRDASKTEYLNYVGVTVPDYVSLDIYVNPDGSSKDLSSLVKIGSSNGVLSPGYHRIKVDSTKLTSDSFSIVVKQTSSTGEFYFSIETPVSGTAYEYVNSEKNSFYSMDGSNWIALSNVKIANFDMTKTDVCIKGFTTVSADDKKDDNKDPSDDKKDDNKDPSDDKKDDNKDPSDDKKDDNKDPSDDKKDDNKEPSNDDKDNTKTELKSDKYTIKNNDVYKIEDETTIDTFLKNVTPTDSIKVYENDKEITDKNSLIKTGMKIKLENGTEYTLIVRGDTNGDGKVTLTDLSKIILHYNETKGFMLSGVYEKGADMNIDGKVSLVDVSQMLVLYNNK